MTTHVSDSSGWLDRHSVWLVQTCSLQKRLEGQGGDRAWEHFKQKITTTISKTWLNLQDINKNLFKMTKKCSDIYGPKLSKYVNRCYRVVHNIGHIADTCDKCQRCGQCYGPPCSKAVKQKSFGFCREENSTRLDSRSTRGHWESNPGLHKRGMLPLHHGPQRFASLTNLRKKKSSHRPVTGTGAPCINQL